MSTPSLTVAITAYNEEKTIEKSLTTVLEAIPENIQDYEIIIINDASKDGTGRIIDELAKKYPHVLPVHNPVNLNQQGCYKKTIKLATKDYYFIIGGDNRIKKNSLHEVFTYVGKGDTVVLPYIENPQERNSFRTSLSDIFVHVLNLLFGFKIRYYNGPTIIKTSILKNLPIEANSFAFMAETVVILLAQGYPYLEIPMVLNPDPKGMNPRAVSRNAKRVLKMIARLFWRVKIKREIKRIR